MRELIFTEHKNKKFIDGHMNMFSMKITSTVLFEIETSIYDEEYSRITSSGWKLQEI